MSRSARWILGGFALCFAFSFWLASASTGAKPSRLEQLLFCFCVLIAVACFSRYLRGMALRLIGGLVFFASVWYLAMELKTKPPNLYSGHFGPSIMNSLLFMLVFGLPGLHVALRGHYPKWGKGAQVFRSPQSPLSEDNAEGMHPSQSSGNAGLGL
jgi:hypothetical protein